MAVHQTWVNILAFCWKDRNNFLKFLECQMLLQTFVCYQIRRADYLWVVELSAFSTHLDHIIFRVKIYQLKSFALSKFHHKTCSRLASGVQRHRLLAGVDANWNLNGGRGGDPIKITRTNAPFTITSVAIVRL